MAASILDRFRAIDTDTHITEPADVWTSRVPRKWASMVPHVERIDGRDVWIVAGEPAGAPGAVTMAGFDGTVPESRKTYEECPPAAFDARARLAFMDAEGVHAQVLAERGRLRVGPLPVAEGARADARVRPRL